MGGAAGAPAWRTAGGVWGPPNAGLRIASVDIIRGVVMILMAIDHVRVYSGLPAGGPEFGIFFTRWITHFCAPAFIFFAGTSAFLYALKHGGPKPAGLSRFLLTRGLWLVILELTFLRVAWTFNFDFMQYEMAGVIWCIGWCMILMGALVRLPVLVVGVLGLVIVAGHNIVDGSFWDIVGSLGGDALSNLWRIFYFGFWAGPVTAGDEGPTLVVLYSIIPWIGVMAAGYGFGRVLSLDARRRDRICLGIGLAGIVLFIVLRFFNIYGDPNPWDPTDNGMPPFFAFLNTSKYPASLLFLLMTLAPTIALVPFLERVRGPLAQGISVFGRVPFFFYVLHIPLAHLLAILVAQIRTPEAVWWLLTNHPMGNPPTPEGYVWNLGTLYLVWAVVILFLFFACRWYARLKARRTDWWLKYL